MSGEDLGFDEQVGEGLVRLVGALRGEGDLEVGGDLEAAGLAAVVGEDEAADLDVVFGRDRDLDVGLQLAVGPVVLGLVRRERRAEVVGPFGPGVVGAEKTSPVSTSRT